MYRNVTRLEAEEENIRIQNGWGPKRIITENGCVTGVEFKKCVSVFDADGKFNPSYDENDIMILDENASVGGKS